MIPHPETAMPRLHPLLLVLPLFVLAAPAQTTWFVDINGTPPGTGTALDPFTSIDFALAQPTTVSGDLVLVLPGTYQETVTFAAKGVTVMSTGGADSTVIDAAGLGSGVEFLGTDGTVMRLDGFKLTGGVGTVPGGGFGDPLGGGIYGENALIELRRCIVKQNQATLGGGIYLQDCVTDIRQCRVRDNLTGGGNQLPHGGGMFVTGGSLNFKRSSVTENLAGTGTFPGKGGGVYLTGASATLRACWITDNVGELEGGGLWGVAQIDKCRFEDNSAQFGGGLYGSSTVLDSVFRGNDADSTSGSSHFGGGVYGAVSLTGCTLRQNFAFGEGAAANNTTLVDCLVDGNQSSVAFGFGSLVTGAVDSCTVSGSTLDGNSSFGNNTWLAVGGGAARSDLVDCDVMNNSANGPVFQGFAPEGGGVWGGTVTASRVHDNFSAGFGGGIASSVVTGTTVYRNSAQAGAGCLDSQLERTTVHGNLPIGGGPGGLYAASGPSTAVDSILWDNGGLETAVDPGATLTITYSDVMGGFAGAGNIDADPLFWNLAKDDYHLQAGSPCIDAGDPISPPDPDGSRADMGAFPYDPSYTGS